MRWRILLLSLLAWAGLLPAAQAQVSPGSEACSTPDPSSGFGVVIGMVREATTQVPMGFVDIRLIPEDLQDPVQLSRSDPGGRFFFCSVPAGIYSVQGWFDQLGGNLTRVAVGAGRTVPLVLGFALAQESNEPGSLTGQLIDADTRAPVEAALVEMPDIHREILTNEEGRFGFPSIRPGTYRIRVTHLGYEDAAGVVAVGGSQAVTIEILMATRVLAMEPITVTATRQEIHALPGMEDLRTRMRSGNGEFIFPGEIRGWVPSRVTDMLHATGVTVMNNGTAIYMRRTSCAPVVYIDDIRVTHGYGSNSLQKTDPNLPAGTEEVTPWGSHEGVDEGNFAALAVNMIPPTDIQAIEIYHGPADTPGQYLDSRSQCGVILIWTRRGPRGG